MLTLVAAQSSDIAGTDLVEVHRAVGGGVIAIGAALVCALVAKWPRRPKPDLDHPIRSAMQFLCGVVVPIFAMLMSVLTMLNGLLLLILRTNGPSKLADLAINVMSLAIGLFLLYFVGTTLLSKTADESS